MANIFVNNNRLIISSDGNISIGTTTTPSVKLHIVGNGHVGIGTIAPSVKLNIGGTIKLNKYHILYKFFIFLQPKPKFPKIWLY